MDHYWLYGFLLYLSVITFSVIICLHPTASGKRKRIYLAADAILVVIIAYFVADIYNKNQIFGEYLINEAIYALLLIAIAAIFTFLSSKISHNFIIFILFVAITLSAITATIIAYYYNKTLTPDPLYTLAVSLCIFPTILLTSYALEKFVISALSVKWWTIDNTNFEKEPSWEGLIKMLTEPECDPLNFNESSPERDDKKSSRDFTKLLLIFSLVILIGLIYGFIFCYISCDALPEFLKNKNLPHPGELNDNLPAFLAMVASAVGILFTYQQLRAKVHADSRQAWNNKFSELLASILSTIGLLSESQITQRKAKMLYEELTRNRVHLELLLNPSEKDHRLIMLLIRSISIPDTTLGHDTELAQKLIVQTELYTYSAATDRGNPNLEAFKEIIGRYDLNYTGTLREFYKKTQTLERIISMIFKLGTAIRKREWERVRHTR